MGISSQSLWPFLKCFIEVYLVYQLHIFKMYNLIDIWIYPWNLHSDQDSEHTSTLQLTVALCIPSFLILLNFKISLHFLSFLYWWNNTACVLLGFVLVWLSKFCFVIWVSSFFLFLCGSCYIAWIEPWFVYPPIFWWVLGHFQFLVVMNKTIVHIYV